MVNKILTTGILLIGITLAINGVTVKADDLLASASSAVNDANFYQFRTALDLYYIDHGNYPNINGGSALIDVLKNENYIKENKPINSDSFNYQVKNDGQDYLLEIKQ